MDHRRRIIKKILFAVSASIISPRIFTRNIQSSKGEAKKIILEKGDCILFYGDSITDGNRDKKNKAPSKPNAIGGGYAMSVSTFLASKYPNMGFTFYNRGINGNKTAQMIARLEADCFQLKPAPTVISLLTGINDYSLSFVKTGKGDPEKYERDLRELLTKIKSAFPKVKLIMMEPYAIKGAREKIDQFLPDFYAYQPIAKKVATDFGAAYVPLQTIFNQAIQNSYPKAYSTDGVHPNSAGIELIKRAWFDVVTLS